MIRAEFDTSVDLFYRAQREITLSTPFGGVWLLGYWVAPTLFLVYAGVAVLTGDTPLAIGVAVGGIAALTYPLGIRALQRNAIRRNLASNPSASSRQEYELTEVGLRNFGDGFSNELRWGAVHRVTTSKSFVLIWISRSFAYFIPRELLTDQEVRQIKDWAAKARAIAST